MNPIILDLEEPFRPERDWQAICALFGCETLFLFLSVLAGVPGGTYFKTGKGRRTKMRKTHFKTEAEGRKALKGHGTKYGFAVADTISKKERELMEGVHPRIQWEQLESLLNLVRTPGVELYNDDRIWVFPKWLRRVVTTDGSCDVFDVELKVDYHKKGDKSNHVSRIKADGTVVHEY